MSQEWKIYTKTGDKGETSLIGGRRVPKDDLQIEAYGTVDELNSFIGLIHAQATHDPRALKLLPEVMDRLFTIESLLAEDKMQGEDKATPSKSLPRIYDDDILRLELEMDLLNEDLPSLHTFILPGGSQAAASCHVARCVCRRAERIVLRLSRDIPVDTLILKYLNRLSDYLFVLARYQNHLLHQEEILWKPRR